MARKRKSEMVTAPEAERVGGAPEAERVGGAPEAERVGGAPEAEMSVGGQEVEMPEGGSDRFGREEAAGMARVHHDGTAGGDDARLNVPEEVVIGKLDELISISGARMEMREIDEVIPYARNARRHDSGQIAKLRGSLRQFGFVKPIAIDERGNLLAGHGILEAARAEGMKKVPCVVVTGLSEVDRQTYIIADNTLSDLSAWDPKMRELEVKRLSSLGANTRLLGLNTDKLGTVDVDGYTRSAPGQGGSAEDGDLFRDRERDEKRQDGNDEYNAFVEKFEQKKTTDDCYTPDIVYDAVADWTAAEYGLDRSDFVRPFFPGGDYRSRDYGPAEVVVDNPPFSILSEIIRFFGDKGIRYFLFAPALSLFSRAAMDCGCCIAAYADIVYENGASVCTSFVTNLEPADVKARTAPTLTSAVEAAVDAYLRGSRKALPKYEFPDHVLTAATMGRWSALGVEFAVKKSDFVRISTLDAMKSRDKNSGIYGGALLLSEKAAAEKAAAEKAAAEKADVTYWQLSQRELGIVRRLGGDDERGDKDAGTEAAD